MPTDEQVLFQLASGLEFIHSNGIFYRGVTPANVLISLTKPVKMKYCDFELSKSVNERGTCTLSEMKGTRNWMSPEDEKMMMSQENEILRGSDGESKMMGKQQKEILRGSLKRDIFSAGCLFLYFLLRGKHPFGNDEIMEIAHNIKDDNPVNVKG
jgi:serine/threonine-protein kinase/endoribonuclease IRE1